ncbi:MAG: STAS domain-containing protein [Acidobacteria bacterium]|nr:STAS domain-containing protein [Acidobacteriota bacterium]
MSIGSRTVVGVTILDLAGRIILGESSVELRTKIRNLVQGGNKHILLNMAEVSHMDSSGIGELVGAYATVSTQGGQLKLLNLTRKLHELLAITKLLTVFESYDSEAQALQSFRNQQ